MPTFGTVCDGIGCGHLAFNQVGFECAWSFEIEAFPSAVLAYKFPEVKNYGDMNKCAGMVESGEIGAPDVFIGGTPCQAFSVAGKRKGLEDARGNLSLTFCGIADAIDDVRERDGKLPCAVLWENVPGVLSDKGNAFGCFLGELSGAGCQIQPPGGRWRNAGCVFGPKRTVAWRVLDSQFFGVAQRRRRVFVVASAGDGFRPEEVLFEREGVRRDSAPSREAGKGVTSDVGSDSKVGHWDGGDCHASEDGTGRGTPLAATYDMRGNGDGVTVGTLTGDHAGRPTDYTPVVCLGKAEEKDIAETHAEVALLSGGDVCRTLSARHDSSPCADRGQEIIAICDVIHGDKSWNGKGWNDGQTVGTLSAQPGMKQQSYIATPMQVRRLTPRECERLQGLPDDFTLIPWRGKPAAECPDGPRYKGIGNGQTVNVMRWLAERIKKAIAV